MDYLQYVDKDSFLHRLDPRTKFFFFLAMAILTSVIKSGVALVFLLAYFLVVWISCGILPEMGKLFKQLKVLLIFIFLLWFVLGLFEKPPVEGGPIFFEGTVLNMQICFDWYDFYKGLVYAVRIYLMIASFFMAFTTMLVRSTLCPALNLEPAIAGSIMALLPGVAMTNGIRDTLEGNYMSGSARMIEAFVIAVSLALGIGVGLSSCRILFEVL